MTAVAVGGAAVASWLFGALWYGLLGERWLRALGKTKAELLGPSGEPSPAPFALAFAAELVMAAILAAALPRLALATAAGGAAAGLLAWAGFVLPALAVNAAYAGTRPALVAIDGGHWLGVLLIQGAILGAFL